MAIKFDLGAVSDYAKAVENGYTGTIDEWSKGLADVINLKDEADQAISNAKAAVEEAETAIHAATAMVGSPLVANNADGMTDQTKVYVYTGDETGYTAGHWYYYDGSAWADGGVYNSIAIQTDTTLTLPDHPADAKATGDEISDIKEDLEENVTLSTWEQGSFNLSTGGNASLTKSIRTLQFIDLTDAYIAIKTLTGYEFAIFCWNKSDATYVGAIKTDGTFTKSSADSEHIWFTNINLLNYSDYRFRVLMRNATSSESDVAISEATNCVFTLNKTVTDKTLTIDGRPADAGSIRFPQYVKIEPPWLSGYIDLTGSIVNNDNYKHTPPIKLLEGDSVCVSTSMYLFSAVSLTDENASYYTPVVKVETGNSTLREYYYTATEDCYVAISAYIGNRKQSVSIKHDRLVTEAMIDTFEKDLYSQPINTLNVTWLNGYIDLNGDMAEAANYNHTGPIKLNKGQIISVTSAFYLFSAVSLTDKDASYYAPVVKVENGGSDQKTYSYTAEEDCYVVISAYNTLQKPASVKLKYGNIVTESNAKEYCGDYCGINIFPFRTIAGKDEYIYKEAVISGLKIPYNFNVLANVNDPNISDYSEKALKFNAQQTAGTYPITIKAVDSKLYETKKTVNVVVKVAPNKKLIEKSELNVCFIGDSLLKRNNNKIGEEWVRMLNTNDSETHISGKAIQLPTLYATDGKINMCGEISTAGFNYTAVANSYNIMRAKRTSTSGAIEHWGSENPFYNPNSAQPDEVGTDGFNKRVDFGWWFDNNIGVGKYPDLIYLATGPNDFANKYGWDRNAEDTVVSQIIAVCKKIKTVCDNRAGGSSDTVIKIVQHQPYRYCCPNNNFPQFMQRVLWFETAEKLFEAIKTEEIDNYTEIIPCGSRFDYDICYDSEDVRINNRYDDYSDIYYTDPIHMNVIGAYNYADMLIADFLADDRFD